jgi:hypothetical protein
LPEKEPGKDMPEEKEKPENNQDQKPKEDDQKNLSKTEDDKIEKYFRKIEKRLDRDRDQLRSKILDIRKNQIEFIIDEIIEGNRIDRVYNRLPMKSNMYDALLDEWERQVTKGEEEIKKDARDARVSLAKNSKKKEEERKKRKKIFEDMASWLVFGAGNFLISYIFQQEAIFRNQGVPENKMKDKLKTWIALESTAKWDYMANAAVNHGWGSGRKLEIENQDSIDYLSYTAILDNATCVNCIDADSKFSKVSPEDIGKIPPVPNPNCLGKLSCRCAWYVVWKS